MVLERAGTADTTSPGLLAKEPEDLLERQVEGGINFKTLAWWQCGVLMIAECISLGILSLPNVMATIGLVPGLILIVVMGVLAGYTGYVVGQFKLRHPGCLGMDSAGMVLFGRWGRELLGFGQLIVLIFIMGAHISTFTTMMNSLTNHATCSIAFSVLGLVLSILPTLFRTLKGISYFSIGSCLSILTAVLIVMIGVGVDKPAENMVSAVQQQPFAKAFISVLDIVLAYSGHITYFTFASELKDPRDFTKSLIMLQTTAVTMYSIAAAVIYYYAGASVPAPAINAATKRWGFAAWIVASVTIIIAGVVNGSVASKQLYYRFWAWRGASGVIKERTVRAWTSWVAIVCTVWLFAWTIAEGIPSFKHLLALVAALFSGWFSFGVTSLFWFNMNSSWRGQNPDNAGVWKSNWRKLALSALNVLIFLCGAIISFVGLYATGKEMHEGKTGKPFSCADNANHNFATKSPHRF
ncbi:amino acid transporter [Tothia fuscella]|uniref:Amino acid transporter n=1 Tax=Tothia fuscella TaxID=1048955 RepID=A0A9P4NFK6_9PEZI|nr:amino acid transporter [Tothia fuscella]